jgi:outer membrane protein OmpA-like peptidoglycan-associated protein
MKIEQVFGQSQSQQDDKPLISNFEMILGLLILALIILFLFISFGYLSNSKKKPHEIPEITTASHTNPIMTKPIATTLTKPKITTTPTSKKTITKPTIKERIYQALLKEFKNDLPDWLAEIEPTTLTIRFQNPDIIFELGEDSLNFYYQFILADFFPRYVNLLKQYAHVIEAVSIEGHTSSEWRSSFSEDEAYFNNMALSQKRTRAVLEYCILLPLVKDDKEWLRQILTANGLSSSRLMIENGSENVEHSRRVEFRIYLHP